MKPKNTRGGGDEMFENQSFQSHNGNQQQLSAEHCIEEDETQLKVIEMTKIVQNAGHTEFEVSSADNIGEIRAPSRQNFCTSEANLNESLVKRNVNLMKRRTSTLSLVDLSQIQGPSTHASQLANRYRRRLSRAMALFQHCAQAGERDQLAQRLAQHRALREQLDGSETARLVAQRTQYALESELSQLNEQLGEAKTAKSATEQQLMATLRDKNAASALARELDEQLHDALKRERQFVQQAQLDAQQMNINLEQIATLEHELRVAKCELSKLSLEAEFSAHNLVAKRLLDTAEMNGREMLQKFEAEKGHRQRAEAQIWQLRDEVEMLREQMNCLKTSKEGEVEDKKRLRQELFSAQEELLHAKRREAETAAKHRAMNLNSATLQEQLRSAMTEAKLAKRQLAIVQGVFSGGVETEAVMYGSELGDFDELSLLEAEESSVNNGGGSTCSISHSNLVLNGGTGTTTSSSGVGEIDAAVIDENCGQKFRG
uniref:Vacuolar protein sorting-associated protein 26B n=1 Tax=Globodera rostochiensis TaxID=31243 RepID=A0A914I5R1_GLORO